MPALAAQRASVDFDDKGDLAVQNPGLYVWQADGTYVPLEAGP